MSDNFADKQTENPQMTETQDYVGALWACGGARRKHVIEKRIHYRLVLDTAGYTVLRCKGTSELLSATRDAFKGKPYFC